MGRGTGADTHWWYLTDADADADQELEKVFKSDIVGPKVCVIQSDDLNARRTNFEEIQSLALPFLVQSDKKGNYDVWQGGGSARKINHDSRSSA